MELTMPSLFKSATGSFVNHWDAMMLQSAEFTVPSWLRSPRRESGDKQEITIPLAESKMV